MGKVNLTVSIADQELPHFREVVAHIKRLGLEVDQELESVGVVTGAIDQEKIQAVKKLKGVAHVEESRKFQIPPPESDVQ
jgi:hypothetical protein